MTRSILVLAEDHDIHADAVYDMINQRGGRAHRINPEVDWGDTNEEAWELPNGEITWQVDGRVGHRGNIKWGNQEFNLGDIGSVYCRNFSFAQPQDNSSMEEQLRLTESSAGLSQTLQTINCFWMNDPFHELKFDSKLVQAIAARKFNLLIPKTLVTNRPSDAREFISVNNDGTVIKQLGDMAFTDLEDQSMQSFGFYTAKLEKQDLDQLDDVRNAPCLFQEHIIKSSDIRVTVVGEKLFAHEIDSQSRAKSKIDFRKAEDLPISDFDFPVETGDKLKNLLQANGIEFAACDFILTPENELFFLEANVSGNWMWLETTEKHPILDAIVDRLIIMSDHRNR